MQQGHDQLKTRHRNDIVGDKIDASGSIEDGTLLAGELPKGQERIIRWWFERSQSRLKMIWNRIRPTDCPVGLIE